MDDQEETVTPRELYIPRYFLDAGLWLPLGELVNSQGASYTTHRCDDYTVKLPKLDTILEVALFFCPLALFTADLCYHTQPSQIHYLSIHRSIHTPINSFASSTLPISSNACTAHLTTE